MLLDVMADTTKRGRDVLMTMLFVLN